MDKDNQSYQNCGKHIFEGEGDYDIPFLAPVNIDVKGIPLIPFNYALTDRNQQEKICHFYIDDYQFDRVWNRPDAYLHLLSKYRAVLTPDFSKYTDFPKAVQIFQQYRQMWCGAYWQSHGITVIPSLGWSDEESFDWCFDGVPHNSIVSISTVGCLANKEYFAGWMKGYLKAMEVLSPSFILFHGNIPNGLEIPCDYTVSPNWQSMRMKINEKGRKHK